MNDRREARDRPTRKDRRAARDRLLIKIAQALELVLARMNNAKQTGRQLREAVRELEEFTKEDG